MRICFFGSSFVNGTGDPDALGWVGRIGAAARHAGRDVTIYNLGIRREISAEIHSRWLEEARRRLIGPFNAAIVFSFGVNDCMVEDGVRRVAPEQTIVHAESMLHEAAGLWPVLMVGPPPVADEAANQRIAALSRALAGVCQRLGIPYLEVFAPLHGDRVWMTEVAAIDGAHPQAGGYAALARLVEAWPAWQALIAAA